jgi:hypothetical protein
MAPCWHRTAAWDIIDGVSTIQSRVRINAPMTRTVLPTLLVLTGLTHLAAGEVRTRFHEFTERFAKRPDRAAVLGITRCGDAGTEWFAAGGVQSDGTVVACGVSLGPTFAPAGFPAVRVLGRDLPAPPAPERPVVQDKKRGAVAGPLTWTHPQATGIIVRYSKDLTRVVSASRLPWTVGGITGAAVDSEGDIYITGPCRDGLDSLGRITEVTPASPPAAATGPVAATYLARISADGSTVRWVLRLAAPSDAPEVRILADGRIRWIAGDFYTVDRAGTVVASAAVVVDGRAGKGGSRMAANPIDGRVALGGDRQWPTGREPYRDPWLHIHRPDGSLELQLYWWPGGYIGLDSLRLVSDSALRLIRWTDQGDLLFVGWSDGGNSVLLREPFDVRAMSPKMRGLGFDAWGAGVLSAAYLVKLDPVTWKVKGGTPMFSYLADVNKPNSVSIKALGFGPGGEVMIGGGSAWGFIQTGNNLIPGGAPGGPFVAILNSEMSSLRFASIVPGLGAATVVDDEPYAFASGSIDGRPVALVLTGSTQSANCYGYEWEAPTTVGAAQTAYGGGLLDAHLMLIDLGTGGADAALATPKPLKLPDPKKPVASDLPSDPDDLPDAEVPKGPPPVKAGGGDESWLLDK